MSEESLHIIELPGIYATAVDVNAPCVEEPVAQHTLVSKHKRGPQTGSKGIEIDGSWP